MRGLDRMLPDHAAFLGAYEHARRCDPGDARPGELVAISGRVEPGPGGVLTAPVSGRPCVWFRVLDLTSPPASPIGPQLPPALSSDMALGAAAALGGTGARDDESPAPFAIVGATGAVAVDPAFADLHTDVVGAHVEGGTYLHGWRLTHEWILPAGTEVFACGEAVPGPDGPALRARPGLPLVVTTGGEAAAVQRARTVAASGVGPSLDRSGATRVAAWAMGGVVGLALLALLIVVLTR